MLDSSLERQVDRDYREELKKDVEIVGKLHDKIYALHQQIRDIRHEALKRAIEKNKDSFPKTN